jgi:hypothetical protein
MDNSIAAFAFGWFSRRTPSLTVGLLPVPHSNAFCFLPSAFCSLLTAHRPLNTNPGWRSFSCFSQTTTILSIAT